MPRSINAVHLGGHVGKDATRYGNGPYKFSLATGGGKKKDGTPYPTHWHQIACWPNQIPEAESVKKGTYVQVKGRLEYEKWTAKDGTEKERAVIVASELSFDAPEWEQAVTSAVQRPLVPDPQPAKFNPRVTQDNPITDEDIPF